MSLSEAAVHRNINLTGTQEEVLAANPQRRYALLMNDSDTACYISLGVPAVVSEGIRLNASGGTFEITTINPFRGRIYAVSAGVTKRLMITELSI